MSAQVLISQTPTSQRADTPDAVVTPRRRIRAVVWVLIAATYAAGVSGLDGGWRFLLIWAGLLVAAALGAWLSRNRLPAPPSGSSGTPVSEPLADRNAAEFAVSVSASAEAEAPSMWEVLIREWKEKRLTLHVSGFHFVPPSVCQKHQELLEQAGVGKTARQFEITPLQYVEEADRLVRALLAIRMSPKIVCLLPIGLIGEMDEARPHLPEWRAAIARAGLRWVGNDVIPLGGGLFFFPIVASFQIQPKPLPSSELSLSERRNGLYVGVDEDGEPCFLPWPWHVVVAGRSGSGKTNTLRHLLTEALLAAKWMRAPLLAVAATAKEDGVAGVLRYAPGSAPRWIPLDRERAIRFALHPDPSRPMKRIRILLVDEAQVLLAENRDLLQAVERGIALGRQNRFAVFLATSNVRADSLPAVITQHAAWLIHPTDSNEASILLRRINADAEIPVPRQTGQAIYVGRDRSVRLVRVPENSWTEALRCVS